MELHHLLRRQLKRLGIDAAALETPAALWRQLLERVSRAYEESDQERYLLEHSQNIASQEMASLHETVRAQRDQLETRVQERTVALRVSESRLESLLSLSADWIWEHDENQRFTYVSEGFEETVGITTSAFLGQKPGFARTPEIASESLDAYHACVSARLPFRDLPYQVTRADGIRRHLRISGEPVFDAAGTYRGYRGVGRDVTQTVLAEQKVQQLAKYDGLTGLPNRSMFLAELERAIHRAQRRKEVCAVCYIDLDRFKTINDTLGHDAGDELIKVMAQRLRATLRNSDLVARLAADEFVVLLECGDALDVGRVAQKILAVIGNPLTLHDVNFLVTASIGISRYPDDGADPATLLKNADSAMVLAKEHGKNVVQFYTAELAQKVARQFALESDLRRAWERGELTLHYQPRVDIARGTVRSVEALLRWVHPLRGTVMPGDFVPIAEERGLIVPIGQWVMQEACRQLRAWHDQGIEPPPVAINLSAKQFASETLVEDLTDAIVHFDVSPAELEVELTESVLMAEPDRANEVLRRLHSMGVRISIDDFGTGYSSLAYLKRFPAHTVKIDRSFISGLPRDKDDMAITRAVIAMAHSLGLDVVAEGVESEDQLQTLRELGCDEAQGYLLGRPMPPRDLLAHLGANMKVVRGRESPASRRHPTVVQLPVIAKAHQG